MIKEIMEFNNFVNEAANQATRNRLVEAILSWSQFPIERFERNSSGRRNFRNFIKN